MKKKAKPSTENCKPTKVCDSYRDMFTMREKPVSEAFIERFTLDILEWSYHSPVLTIMGFFKKKGISHSTFRSWRDKYPKLKEGYEHALEIIGERRELGALNRKLAENTVLRSMSNYSYDWSVLEAKREAYKTQQQNNNKSVITIKMEDWTKLEKKSTSTDSTE